LRKQLAFTRKSDGTLSGTWHEGSGADFAWLPGSGEYLCDDISNLEQLFESSKQSAGDGVAL
jgi:hypothetical protein